MKDIAESFLEGKMLALLLHDVGFEEGWSHLARLVVVPRGN